MKKTIALTHPKLQPARLADAIKHDIKKYLRKERNKTLPPESDYWTFDCRFGESEETAQTIYTSEISKHIDYAIAQGLPEFYIEVVARPANHKPSSGQHIEF